MTNTGLMIFTANIFALPLVDRWIVFLVIEHILLFFMAMVINYYPKTTLVQKDIEKRHKFLIDRHFYGTINSTGSARVYPSKFELERSINFKDISDS